MAHQRPYARRATVAHPIVPSTMPSRAVSTTSLLMVWRPLISRMRSIWAKSLCNRRKFPTVMRTMAAIASTSVQSLGEKESPSSRHRCSSTKCSSSAEIGRYSWTKPTRE